MFKDELFSGSGPITVWINSPGGDCIAASQIYTILPQFFFAMFHFDGAYIGKACNNSDK